MEGEEIEEPTSQMSDGHSTTNQVPNKAAASPSVELMATKLQCWREILVHLDRILNWERPRVLIGIQIGMTLTFILIWLLGPSLLTSVALVGLLSIGLDFSVPILAPRMFERSAWTKYEEEHFLVICEKLVRVQTSITDTATWILDLRRTRPSFYFTLMAVFFVIVAFIGDKFNNLFLSYFFITAVMMTPGLIKHGILSRLYGQVMKVVEQKMGKKMKKR